MQIQKGTMEFQNLQQSLDNAPVSGPIINCLKESLVGMSDEDQLVARQVLRNLGCRSTRKIQTVFRLMRDVWGIDSVLEQINDLTTPLKNRQVWLGEWFEKYPRFKKFVLTLDKYLRLVQYVLPPVMIDGVAMLRSNASIDECWNRVILRPAKVPQKLRDHIEGWKCEPKERRQIQFVIGLLVCQEAEKLHEYLYCARESISKEEAAEAIRLYGNLSSKELIDKLPTCIATECVLHMTKFIVGI